MFGLSFWEIGLIMAVALIVLGPKKLPEMAKKLGEGLREFRNATSGFKSVVEDEIYKPPAPATGTPQQTTSEPAQIEPPVAQVNAEPDEADIVSTPEEVATGRRTPAEPDSAEAPSKTG